MMSPRPQGDLTVERLCMLAGVSRAGYYRQWAASMPRQEETAIRDAVQRVALANRRYGYRRVTRELSRNGIVVNHKRVLRLMRDDNLLCLRTRPFVPMTTDSRHDWCVVPNLVRHGTNRPRSALGGRYYLYPAVGRVRVFGRAARCVQPKSDRLGVGKASAREPRFDGA